MSAEQPNPWNELRLNTQSPVPLWVQLGRELRRCIAEHKLPVGTPLPSESWIVTRYGLTVKATGKTYDALHDIGQIDGKRGEGYHVAEETPLEYVTVVPGSKITAPAPHDPSIESDLPWWAVIALRVEAPGMEPLYFDSTRTVLLVA
jgi:DNA-binding transcriptional MocR family regulator